MKKIFLSLFIIWVLFALPACANDIQSTDLADMTTGHGDGYATVVWGDKTYVPYGPLSAYGKRGKQIGIVDGDRDHKVYECKGYHPEEWIVAALPHDAAMLLREVNVTAIPVGWQSEYEWNN